MIALYMGQHLELEDITNDRLGELGLGHLVRESDRLYVLARVREMEGDFYGAMEIFEGKKLFGECARVAMKAGDGGLAELYYQLSGVHDPPGHMVIL